MKTPTDRTSVATLADLQALVGQELGTSPWLTVDQETVNAFAQTTGDRQWIHVDVERAARESPFGGTIVHGFLILGFAPRFVYDVLRIDENDAPGGVKFGVNYGLDRVRFVSPLPVGSRLRARVSVQRVEALAHGAKFVLKLEFEREGGERPVAVAEWIQRVYT